MKKIYADGGMPGGGESGGDDDDDDGPDFDHDEL